MTDNDNGKDPIALLSGYFRGELTPEEQESLEMWIQESPENRKMAIKACRMEQYANEYSLRESQGDDSVLKMAAASITRARKHSRARWLRAAICSAAVLAMIISLRLGHLGQKDNWNTLTTADGGISCLVLPDSSKVWLNSNSTLTYPDEFKGSIREVRLEGEAFFDVVKNESHPFIVSTQDCRVKVRGTQFDVSDYPDAADCQTTLVSGSVEMSVKGHKASTVLLPGQRLSYQSNTGDVDVSWVDAESLTSWRTGTITFDHTALKDVLTLIGNTFGIRFIISGSGVVEDTYTGSFSGQSLEEVLSTLGKITRLNFKPLEVKEGDAFPRYIVYRQ